MLYITRMTQNKNDSINSILQCGRVVDRNCCVLFLASGFPYLILYPRYFDGNTYCTVSGTNFVCSFSFLKN